MAQFVEMFPETDARVIEAVLRRHNGEVAATIDELLRRSEGIDLKMGQRKGEEGGRRQGDEAEEGRKDGR